MIQSLRWIDLPVEEIRVVLDDTTGDALQQILTEHRRRLELQQSRTEARLADVDHYLAKGITMAPVTGARPVQLKITVDDADAAIAFYQKAFGFHYDVTRRTQDAEYSSFMFGRYGADDFFLLHLLAEPEQADRLGPTTFGLLVDDLDDCHARALDAGGTEVSSPHDVEGMPRCFAIKDPSGNWIWLYQGWSQRTPKPPTTANTERVWGQNVPAGTSFDTSSVGHTTNSEVSVPAGTFSSSSYSTMAMSSSSLGISTPGT